VITVVTAMGLEYKAARNALPVDITVLQAGISLNREHDRISGTAISCGVAGGLRNDLPSGTVLVPRSVRRPDGTIEQCDPQMVEALLAAARSMGCDPVDAPLLTSAAIVRGAERQTWAAQGYAGVDMETGLIKADAVAAVRVILDTPKHEISAAWGNPKTVVFHPAAWLDIPMMAREAPRGAKLAAQVIASALRSSSVRSANPR
jgi:hypothetical protein